MVTTRTRTHGLLCATVAGSLALAAAGCSAGDDGTGGKKADTSVTAEHLCGGAAESTDAGEALEVITGSARFEASGEKSTVPAAAQELTRTAASSASGNGDICRIYPPLASPVEALRITWELSGSAPKQPSASKFTLLPMGERAGTAPDGAFIAFTCHDENLPNSTPHHIAISVEPTGMPTDPEGDTQALQDAYATVAHSFSLAMAKELGCSDDGGLEARPSLTPA
jgi:hypothetical protein